MAVIKQISSTDRLHCVEILHLISDLMDAEKEVRDYLGHGEWFPIKEEAFDVMADGILKYITTYSYRNLYNMHETGSGKYFSKYKFSEYETSGFTMDVVHWLIFYVDKKIKKETVVEYIEQIIRYHIYLKQEFYDKGILDTKSVPSFDDFISGIDLKLKQSEFLLKKLEELELQIAKIRKELR